MAAPDFYLLAYDIASERRRVKIARLMESVGARVQGSVFEAYLTPADLAVLLRRVHRVLKPQEDSLRVYYICEACLPKARTFGKGEVTSPPGLTII